MIKSVTEKRHFVWERQATAETSTPLLRPARHCSPIVRTDLSGKVCIITAFCHDKAEKHFFIPFSLPFTFNDHNLIEFDAQNRPKCWKRQSHPIFFVVGGYNEKSVTEKRHFVWEQHATVDISTPLLIPARHCWYQHATVDTSTPLLIPARHYWYQHATVDTSTPLFIPARHCWYQHATALLLFVRTFRCTMTLSAHRYVYP